MNGIECSLPWLQPSWLQLKHYIKHDRVPQALLITGNKGLGKNELARHFSKLLLCSRSNVGGFACEKCQSCVLFDANTHPDFTIIKPEEEGKVIGISVIRELTSKLELKPQFESYRVVIISPAESLNEASANAFLKYLEEPTDRTCLILISGKPHKLPATIKSRCQKLGIALPNEQSLNEWWKNQGNEDNLKLLLNLAQGAPLLAKQLAGSEWLTKRHNCFQSWKKITSSKISFVDVAEQWSKFSRVEVTMLLFWIISWVMDITKLSYRKQTNNIVNLDFSTDLKEISVKLDLKDLYNYYDFLLLCQQRLDTQLNKQLMIEEILIKWSKLNGR